LYSVKNNIIKMLINFILLMHTCKSNIIICEGIFKLTKAKYHIMLNIIIVLNYSIVIILIFIFVNLPIGNLNMDQVYPIK